MSKKSEESISVVEIDKKKYKELVKNQILLKRENENLKIENDEIQKLALDKYNEIKTCVSKSTMSDVFQGIQNNIEYQEKCKKNNFNRKNDTTSSSIFKKRSKSENKSSHTSSHKSIDKSSHKSNCKSIDKSSELGNQYSSDETNSDNIIESDDTSTEYTSEYTSESDIYRIATTDDGINKTYKKLNDEMKKINAIHNCISNEEISNRINFLLNGLKILDNLRNNKK